jgi:CheY-like chemotaxis protein
MIKLNSVLLVDDDVINNFINARLIKKIDMSHHLHISTNGKEAITYLSGKLNNNEVCPELILLDINMPVMDGFEFVDAFRKLNFPNQAKIVIIMLTTSSNPKDLENVEALNIGGYINKPLTEEKLKNALSRNFVK